MVHRKKGFTLIELLVVVSIIALLVSILMPALSEARRQAKNSLDQNNQHQIGIGLIMYANEYNSSFPRVYSGNWLFDVSYATTNYLVENGGDRKIMYCPLEKYKNPDDDLFWYAGEVYNLGLPLPENRPVLTAEEEKSYFRVTGYNWLFAAAPGYEMWRPDKNSDGTQRYFNGTPRRTWVKKATQADAADTEIVTCMTYSDGTNGETSRFEDLVNSGNLRFFGVKDTTAHLTRDSRPRGGNILYVDGHVDWRAFDDMQIRYTIGFGGGAPYHWW